MKKFKLALATLLCMLLAISSIGISAFAVEGYDKTVDEKNNLATNKYDWVTDKVATGSVVIDENEGMTFENFTLGSSVYALYQTNKVNEFKYSMYAKLDLKRPSEFGYDYQHDYSNLYISFQINSSEPIASAACPWNGNKANFSICFENLQGYSKVVLYLNESFVGSGANRQMIAEAQNVQWNDGEYHWFDFEFTNDEVEEEYRGKIRTVTGKRFKFFFDGVLALEYFQRDVDIYTITTKDYVNYDFSNTSGYIGFWPSSDFPVGADSNATGCRVNIKTVEITSLDGENEVVFEKCPAPDFPINTITYAPAASYETDIDIEIKLDKLFSYEGDETMEYSAKCAGEDIGAIRNGYWVWLPTEAGEYIVTITAKVGDKTATNHLILNIVAAQGPEIPMTSEPAPAPSKGGCGGSFAGSAFTSLLAVCALAIVRGKKR